MKAFHPVVKRLRLRRLPLLVLLLLVISSGFDAQAQFPKAQASTDQELANLEAQLNALESQRLEAAVAMRNTPLLDNESLVDRVARIDQWKAEQQETLNAAAALKVRIAAKKGAVGETPVSVTPPARSVILSDPILQEIGDIHDSIFAAIAPLRETEISLIDRIAWIDEFKKVNKPLFELLAEKEQIVFERNAEAAKLLANRTKMVPGLTAAEQGRFNQANSKLREISERANALPLVERIAAMDAASREIQDALAEVKNIYETLTSNPSAKIQP